MKHSIRVTTVAVGLALLASLSIASNAAGTPARPFSTPLQLHAVVGGHWEHTNPDCTPPPGESGLSFYRCYNRTGTGLVPGVGHVSQSGQMVYRIRESSSCTVDWRFVALWTVTGKGTIELTETVSGCWEEYWPSGAATWTVTGGSGVYAGVSGAGTTDVVASQSGDGRGPFRDTRVGTLTVPGFDFDLAPPSLRGAISKTVRAPKKAKHRRVRYAVTATDAVDGSTPVTCRPASGSSFRIGRTKVRCGATDSSGNAAKAAFTITVKRRH